MPASIFETIAAGDASSLESLLLADPDAARARNEAGVSALLFALYTHRDALVPLVRARVGELDVFESAALGEVTRLREILAESRDAIRRFSGDGFTALHLAAFFAQPACVQALIDAGADVNAVARNPMSVTPLHSAAAASCLPCAQALIQGGADVNARQSGGFVPLDAALQNGDSALESALLAAGADASFRVSS
jgi:ankyrin repeat protein